MYICHLICENQTHPANSSLEKISSKVGVVTYLIDYSSDFHEIFSILLGYWLSCMLSMFFTQMQAHSQGLWVLCAEIGVAWHILGAGEVSEPHLSVLGNWLSSSSYFSAK